MQRVTLLVSLISLCLAKLHDSDVPGLCSVNWDGTNEQLALDTSVCCDGKMHRTLHRQLTKLNAAKANASEVMQSILSIAPEYSTHIIAAEGILAISAPGPGPNFCKERVGRLSALIQSSPVEVAYPSPYSVAQNRTLGCTEPELAVAITEISAKFKLPGKFTPAQIVRIVSRALLKYFGTRFWLTLSEKRVTFHSNAFIVCEFPLGRYTLGAFTFQALSIREEPVIVVKTVEKKAAVSSPSLSTALFSTHTLSPLSSSSVTLSSSSFPLPTSSAPLLSSSVPLSSFSVHQPSSSSTQPSSSAQLPSSSVTLSSSSAPILSSSSPLPSSSTPPTTPSSSFVEPTPTGLSLPIASPSALNHSRAEGTSSNSSRVFKRQTLIGRNRLGGCGHERLRQIMQRILGPLLMRIEQRIGDIAKRLQEVVQRTTGRSFEVFIAKGDFVSSSHQMKTDSHCRARIGSMFTMVYETPVPYNINDEARERLLTNVDFGEPLGTVGGINVPEGACREGGDGWGESEPWTLETHK